MASQIDVVFNADTGRYVANVNAATGATTKSAEAVAAAKNKILESMEAQIKKASDLGASQQRLQAIAERAASQMSAVTEQNADRIIRNLDRILERNRQVASELANLKVPKVDDNEGLSRKQAASAVLRGGGLRSAENVFGMVASEGALQTAGMAFGVTALAGVLFDMGEKGYEAFEKVRHASELTKSAFDELHDKAQISIDDKEIENQKIQDQIDKLSGHPNNGLESALLAAKKMADQLIESLKESRHQEDELFKQFDTGKLGSALSFLNLAPDKTSAQEKNLRQDSLDREAAAQDARDRYSAAYGGAKTDAQRKAATEQLNKELGGIFDSDKNGIGSYQREIARLKKEDTDSAKMAMDAAANGGDYRASDNSQKITELEGVVKNLQDQKRLTQLDTSIFNGQADLGRVKQGKDQAADARKAMEEQRKGWENDDNTIKQYGADPAAMEVTAWQQRLAGLKVGSEQYIYARNQLTEKMTALSREDAERGRQSEQAQRQGWDQQHNDWEQAGKRSAEDEAKFWAERMRWSAGGSENYLYAFRKQTEAILAAQREREAADRARSKASLQQGQSQTAYAEAILGIQQLTGQISRQDAAIQLANIHTEQYRQKLAALQAEFSRQQGINPDSAATIEAGAAVAKAETDRQIQIQQDAAAMAAQTWEGALKNANAVWVQDSQDSAKQVVEIYRQALDGLNENLADLMVGDKSHFAQMFKGIGKTLATDALKRGESALFGKAVGGKPDGTASNPLHVLFAGSMGQNPLGGFGDAFGKPKLPKAVLAGGSDDDEDDDGPQTKPGGFLGFLKSLKTNLFGGGRAIGGGVNAGTTYLIGEKGPELFTPGASGAVTPNHALGGGNGATYYVSVGNGVTPEQMNMHMQSVLSQYHDHVMRGSVHAMQDHAARMPSAARG